MECILWRCKAIFILGLSGNGTRIDEATANSAQSKFVRGVWVLDFDFRLPTPTAISAQIKSPIGEPLQRSQDPEAYTGSENTARQQARAASEFALRLWPLLCYEVLCGFGRSLDPLSLRESGYAAIQDPDSRNTTRNTANFRTSTDLRTRNTRNLDAI
eukprot:2337412-Rhodomonas_salina.2